MVTQVTISPSFQKKMSKLEELIGDNIAEKLTSLGHYAVEISPVYSGAFVQSWSLVPIGSGGGRSRASAYGKTEEEASRLKNKGRADAETKKSEAKDLIDGDVNKIKDRILKDGGAVLTNRAPHAKIVDNKYLTITRVKDRFR